MTRTERLIALLELGALALERSPVEKTLARTYRAYIARLRRGDVVLVPASPMSPEMAAAVKSILEAALAHVEAIGKGKA